MLRLSGEKKNRELFRLFNIQIFINSFSDKITIQAKLKNKTFNSKMKII